MMETNSWEHHHKTQAQLTDTVLSCRLQALAHISVSPWILKSNWPMNEWLAISQAEYTYSCPKLEKASTTNIEQKTRNVKDCVK